MKKPAQAKTVIHTQFFQAVKIPGITITNECIIGVPKYRAVEEMWLHNGIVHIAVPEKPVVCVPLSNVCWFYLENKDEQ